MKTKASLTIASCFLVSALVLSPFAFGQQVPPEPQFTTPGIAGVVAAGMLIERVWTGQQSADGLIGEPDGTLLLPEQGADRVSRVDPDVNITPYLEDTNEGGGLALDARGRLVAIERGMPRIRILIPERRILAEGYDGIPFENLNDIVADQKGGVYVTAGVHRSVYYLNPSDQLIRLADDVEGANGVMLSPDDGTLYVTNTQAGILAWDVAPDGSISNRRPFGRPPDGQDGFAVDATGRLYVAGDSSVQVFTPDGQHIGSIPFPRDTTTLAFAGPEKKTLYVIGRGNNGPEGEGGNARSMYRIQMLAEGYKGRPK